MAKVLLALDDVGVAVQLQESLEALGHDVSWHQELARGPTADFASSVQPDAVFLDARPLDEDLGSVVDAWRGHDPSPGIVVLGSQESEQEAAHRARAIFLGYNPDMSRLRQELSAAVKLRFSCALSHNTAMRALGMEIAGSSEDKAIRVVTGAKNVDIEVAQAALRWHGHKYVTANQQIALLRQHRALEIPQIEFTRLMDGTRTIPTVVKSAPLNPMRAVQTLWALASIGAVELSRDPPDQRTETRRAITQMRRHLVARHARLERSTYYDVLEVRPTDSREQVVHASRCLAVRYDPERLNTLDLGIHQELVAKVWNQIREARAALLEHVDRTRYNEWLTTNSKNLRTEWLAVGLDPKEAARAFGRGHRALIAGEVFKAISEIATAARLHPGHPDYEATLSWARFRAAVTKGTERKQAACAERAIAEEALYGRRPWPRALMALGMLCAADGDVRAARWHLSEALAVDPQNPAVKQVLARIGHKE